MLGISFVGVKPEWSEDFENLSAERKKKSNIKSKNKGMHELGVLYAMI